MLREAQITLVSPAMRVIQFYSDAPTAEGMADYGNLSQHGVEAYGLWVDEAHSFDEALERLRSKLNKRLPTTKA